MEQRVFDYATGKKDSTLRHIHIEVPDDMNDVEKGFFMQIVRVICPEKKEIVVKPTLEVDGTSVRRNNPPMATTVALTLEEKKAKKAAYMREYFKKNREKFNKKSNEEKRDDEVTRAAARRAQEKRDAAIAEDNAPTGIQFSTCPATACLRGSYGKFVPHTGYVDIDTGKEWCSFRCWEAEHEPQE